MYIFCFIFTLWKTLHIPNIYIEKCGEKSTIYFCTYTLCNRQWNRICKMLFLQKALFPIFLPWYTLPSCGERLHTHIWAKAILKMFVYYFRRRLLILINIPKISREPVTTSWQQTTNPRSWFLFAKFAVCFKLLKTDFLN